MLPRRKRSQDEEIKDFGPPKEEFDPEFEQELQSPEQQQGGSMDSSAPVEISQILQSMENASSLPWTESSRSYQVLSSLARNVVPNIIQSYASGLSPQEKEKLISSIRREVFGVGTEVGKLWKDAADLDQEFALPGRPYGPVSSLVNLIKVAADEEDEEEYEDELEDEEDFEEEEDGDDLSDYEEELEEDEEEELEEEEEEEDDDNGKLDQEDEEDDDQEDEEEPQQPEFQLPQTEPDAVKKIRQVFPAVMVGTQEGEALALSATPTKLISSWVDQYIPDRLIEAFVEDGQTSTPPEDAKRQIFALAVGYVLLGALQMGQVEKEPDQDELEKLYEEEAEQAL
jgi:hypothetical protein